MTNVLITGGAGFVGSHLCKYLLKSNYHVTVLDNLYTGSLTNLANVYENENFKFIQDDVRVPFDFNNNFDFIFNLACPASPSHYQKTPLKTMQTSVYGAFHVLEFAQKNNSTVLQASTSEIYGDPQVHPQPESYFGNVNPNGVRSCYDEGKRAAESIFFDFYRNYNIPIKIIRIFNTYGPFMNIDDGRVVSNFIMQALKNQDITIYGNGKQTRSFCFIDDLILGMVKMMHSEPSITGPINLGSTYEFTILDLAKKIIAFTNSKSKITFNNLPEDDPKERRPDITKARFILNWEPSITIDDGLKITIDYFKRFIS